MSTARKALLAVVPLLARKGLVGVSRKGSAMRVQVLHLPAPADQCPFALVVDEYQYGGEAEDARLRQFATEVGAKGTLISADRVEVS